MELDPWENVTAADLAAYLDSSLVPDEKLSTDDHLILFPERRTSIRDALTTLAAEGAPEDEMEDHLDDIDYLLRRFAPPEWVVTCYVTDSMTSGVWGLRQLRLGGRGYLFVEPDFCIGSEDEDLPVLAGWEPFENESARRRCILHVYQQDWDHYGWPPFMGQWARADPVLLQEAVGRILKDSKELVWGEMLAAVVRIKTLGALTPSLVEQASALSGIELRRTQELADRLPGNEYTEEIMEPYPLSLANAEESSVGIALFVLAIAVAD